jgi:hypothetical protein
LYAFTKLVLPRSYAYDGTNQSGSIIIKEVRQMEEIWEFAKKQMEGAQEIEKRNADRHRREVDFQVGDEVWLSLKSSP